MATLRFAIGRDKFFVFLGLSGYLFGREYVEVIALRRPDGTAIRPVCYRVANHRVPAAVVRLFDGFRRIRAHLPAS